MFIVFAAMSAGCSDGVRDQQRSAAASANASTDVGLLFSVLAPTMEVAANGADFTLTIPTTSPIAWFTDRPERTAGSITADDLVSMWSAEEFDTDPPNAAIVVRVNGETHQHVVELTAPIATALSVSFHVRDVGDETADNAVAGRKATHDVAVGVFANAELFIDDGVYPPCASTMTSAGPNCVLGSTVVDSGFVPGPTRFPCRRYTPLDELGDSASRGFCEDR